MSEYRTRGIATIAILIGIAALFVVLYNSQPVAHEPSEIAAITSTSSIPAQSAQYRSLINRVGLADAQELLYRSGMPFNGQTHLLNHTAGEYAYEKHGRAGIVHCKDYFLQSCYHGVTIATIAHEGMQALPEVMATCRARGGDALAAQCAHGIGHGLVAWLGYARLPDALAQCDAFAQTNDAFPVFHCHDGAFMENLWGVHSGEPSPDRWIKAGDLTFPCSSKAIRPEWQRGCWANQASVMFRLTRGEVETVASACATRTNAEHRRLCFDGLTRQIHPITRGNVRATRELCGRTDQFPGVAQQCLAGVAAAEYAVGGRKFPFALCNALTGSRQDYCYQNLIETMRAYGAAATECAAISNREQRRVCQTQVQS